MNEVYQSNEKTDVVEDTLEAKVREGARLMLAAALDEEVHPGGEGQGGSETDAGSSAR